MSTKPRDLKDLFLVPIASVVEENLNHLVSLSKADIILRIGLETDMRLDTPKQEVRLSLNQPPILLICTVGQRNLQIVELNYPTTRTLSL